MAAPECDAVPHRDQSAGAALPLPGAWGQNYAHAVVGTGFAFYAALRSYTKKQASFAELLEINLQTAKAWCYKEQFIEFWAQPDAAHGAQFFADWHRSVVRTRLTRVKAVAKTLKKHLTNLLTYFVYPITNAISEGFNSKIQAINLKTAVETSEKSHR